MRSRSLQDLCGISLSTKFNTVARANWENWTSVPYPYWSCVQRSSKYVQYFQDSCDIFQFSIMPCLEYFINALPLSEVYCNTVLRFLLSNFKNVAITVYSLV